jgi:hypothetical protein
VWAEWALAIGFWLSQVLSSARTMIEEVGIFQIGHSRSQPLTDEWLVVPR